MGRYSRETKGKPPPLKAVLCHFTLHPGGGLELRISLAPWHNTQGDVYCLPPSLSFPPLEAEQPCLDLWGGGGQSLCWKTSSAEGSVEPTEEWGRRGGDGGVTRHAARPDFAIVEALWERKEKIGFQGSQPFDSMSNFVSLIKKKKRNM